MVLTLAGGYTVKVYHFNKIYPCNVPDPELFFLREREGERDRERRDERERERCSGYPHTKFTSLILPFPVQFGAPVLFAGLSLLLI